MKDYGPNGGGNDRAKVLRDAEALKKEITFKPCERTVDYELPFSPTTSKP